MWPGIGSGSIAGTDWEQGEVRETRLNKEPYISGSILWEEPTQRQTSRVIWNPTENQGGFSLS